MNIEDVLPFELVFRRDQALQYLTLHSLRAAFILAFLRSNLLNTLNQSLQFRSTMPSQSQASPNVSSRSAEPESRQTERSRLAATTPATQSRLPPPSDQTQTTHIPPKNVSDGLVSTSNTTDNYPSSISDPSLADLAATSTQATSASHVAWLDDYALLPQDRAERYNTYGYMCMANPCFQANCYIHIDAAVRQEYSVTGIGSGFISTDDEYDSIVEDNDDP